MPKNIKSQILKDIAAGHIYMRPKSYFVLGSILSALGLTLSAIMTLAGIHLLRFRLSHPGPGASRKIAYLIELIPWYVPLLAISGLVVGYYLLKKYEFSYRKNLTFIIVAAILSMIVASYALSFSGFDDYLTRRGYFRQIYRQQHLMTPLPLGRMLP